MLDALVMVGFLHRDDCTSAVIVLQVAITAARTRGERHRLASPPTGKRLQIDLLVAFINESNTFIGEAKRTATVFVYPTAQGKFSGCQALRRAVAPVPEGATRIGGIVLNPEQAPMPGTQLCEVAAGRGGLLSGPVATPEAIRRFGFAHIDRFRSVRHAPNGPIP